MKKAATRRANSSSVLQATSPLPAHITSSSSAALTTSGGSVLASRLCPANNTTTTAAGSNMSAEASAKSERTPLTHSPNNSGSHSNNFPHTILPHISTPKKVGPLGCLAGGGGKRRRIHKFYQQQCSLLESYEADSRQIADFQQSRNTNNQQRVKSNSAGDELDEEEGHSARVGADFGRPYPSGTAVAATSAAGGSGTDQSAPNNGTGARDFKLDMMEDYGDENENGEGESGGDDEEEDGDVEVVEDFTIPLEKGNGRGGRRTSKGGGSELHRQICATNSSRASYRSTKSLAAPGRRAVRRLAIATLLVNLALTIAKGIASYLSGSLSIISSLVDSLVDITSGLVIWLTSRAIKKHDPYLYPVGRTRLEPVALVIVSVIMAVASVQMVVQSVESLLANRVDPHVDPATLVIMLSTVAVKMVLYVICNRYQADPSTRVLAQDHRNDCLSNSIALVCAYCAQRLWIYLDPIGAVLVAIYIIATWYRTGREQLLMLSGRSASPEFINRIIKVCIDHDERINFIDTVYVYHFGTRFLVEVHIVLDPEMRLRETHDLSEALQNNIESLPEVERAFVHVDYEYEHKPEDEHKPPLG